MSLADRLSAPDVRRGGRGASQTGRSPRHSPYARPESGLPPDGNWVHDKFAEINDIPAAGGALASRISGGQATGSGAGAKLLAKALEGQGGSRLGARVGGSLSIKGASGPASTTLEIRELVAGTTPDDVKAIFSACGAITDAWTVNDASSGRSQETTVIRVKFAERVGMTKAIQQYDGQQADGRVLSVKEVYSVAPSADVIDDDKPRGKMYSDNIDGGVTITAPPRVEVVSEGRWERGGRGGGGGGRGPRGRGGRGRGRGGRDRDVMQVD